MSTPTLILIHDSFHLPTHYIPFSGSLQSLALRELRIPQLPSCSQTPPEDAFEADIAIVRKTILSCLNSGRDVMLIAHGYGGKVVSDALAGVPVTRRRELVKVLGVVFVAGVVCEEGESEAGGGEGDVQSYVKSEGDLLTITEPSKLLFNTLTDGAQLEKAASSIVPFATSAALASAKTASWSNYPCAYIQCLQDKAFPVSSQDRCISKLQKRCEWDPAVASLDCDHDPFLSSPQQLAQLMKTLVNDTLQE